MKYKQQEHRSTDSWIELFEGLIAITIQLVILTIAVFSVVDARWLTAFSGSVVLLLTFLPAALEKQLRVRIPIEVSLFVCLFLFASYVLGEVGNFYEHLWWWDLALHGSSAFVIGLIGFLVVYVFYMTHRIRIAAVYVAAVSFGTAVTFGTLWEIFEFLMDTSFGLNMQKSGLADTMTDLMVNALGALLAAAVGYYYMRHGDELMGRKAIRAFVERGRKSRIT